MPTELDLGLHGRVALVTGGARGIGRAISASLTAAGARVAIHYFLSRAQAEELAQELAGSRIYAVDLSGDGGPADLMAAVLRDFGGIDILVNNAGVLIAANTESTTPEDWAGTLRVNLTVPFLLSQLALPSMRERGAGSIVNVASIAGITGGNAGPAYGASKGGLVALTKYLARDCARFGVRVNAVAPTLTDTELIRQPLMEPAVERQLAANPMGRLAQPDEVAGAVVFLCSTLASYVNGECLAVWGGP